VLAASRTKEKRAPFETTPVRGRGLPDGCEQSPPPGDYLALRPSLSCCCAHFSGEEGGGAALAEGRGLTQLGESVRHPPNFSIATGAFARSGAFEAKGLDQITLYSQHFDWTVGPTHTRVELRRAQGRPEHGRGFRSPGFLCRRYGVRVAGHQLGGRLSERPVAWT
jgi:hypothetical protein